MGFLHNLVRLMHSHPKEVGIGCKRNVAAG